MVCAVILGRVHGHGDGHEHQHGHGHHGHAAHGHQHEDLNLRSAYLHVLADALTSVLAILALAGGWFWGWSWLDPVMGLVGAVLVAVWARGLIVDTSRVLLDREMDHPVVDEIREVVATLNTRGPTVLTDLHVWRVGRDAYACTLTLVSEDPDLSPARVHHALGIHEELVHCTVEIHRSAGL